MKIYSQSEVRAMRDRVYGKPLTDPSWEACKYHWMKPDEIAWLQEQVKKLK